MFNARALLAALIGLSTSANASAPMNILPRSYGGTSKKRRKVDHLRARAKRLHSGYPGAKLDRKRLLGEVGTARPQ